MRMGEGCAGEGDCRSRADWRAEADASGLGRLDFGRLRTFKADADDEQADGSFADAVRAYEECHHE